MTMRQATKAAVLGLMLFATVAMAQMRLIEVDAPEGGTRDELMLETILLLPDRTLVTLRFEEEMCGAAVHRPPHEHAFHMRASKGDWVAPIRAVAGVLEFDVDRECAPAGSRLVLDFPPVPEGVVAVDVVEGEGGVTDDVTLWTWRRISLE
jgi:hypothetical protein